MKERAFNIPFYLCDSQQLYAESCDYIEEPALHTIFFVSGEHCRPLSEAGKLLTENERIQWIPGDDAVRSLFRKRGRSEQEECSVKQYVFKMCEYAADMGLDVCILMDKAEEEAIVLEEIRKTYPYLAIHSLNMNEMQSMEMLVNDINSIAPEILILGIRLGELRHYMEYERRKTNARLCICVGNLLIEEMTKKKKMFHTITMSRRLKKNLQKYSKRNQKS